MTTPQPASRSPVRVWWVWLAVLSGFSALSYQVIWVRSLTQYVGGGAMAVPIVLTVFMGGLALGGALASRALAGITDPSTLLRGYGWIEIGIGTYALLFPLFCRAVQPAYAWLYAWTGDGAGAYDLLSALLSMTLLLPPTTLMGATLPVLAGCLAAERETVGTRLGQLYGLNTLGAAVGALACGFWMLPSLGVAVSTGAAAGLSVLGGLVALRLGRGVPTTPKTDHQPNAAPRQADGASPATAVWPYGVLLAVAGFSSMGYEVVWTKLISLLVGPTTYSFTVVLVTFITGLGLGSLLIGPWVDRVRSPQHLLLWTQLGAVVCALLASQGLGQAQLLMAKILFVNRDHFMLSELAKAGVLFAALLPATVLQGAALPVTVRILRNAGSATGVATGRLYTWNTVGAVLGAATTGFVIIPRLGQAGTLSVLAALQAVVAAVVIGTRRPFRLGSVGSCVLGGLAATALCVVLPRWDATLLGLASYQRFGESADTLRFIPYMDALLRGPRIIEGRRSLQRTLSLDEDGVGFVAVLEVPEGVGPPIRQLTVSGKVDASTGGDMGTQTMLAHIPLLNHPRPERALVIGLGSGVTAGEALLYPLKQLDIVEISPAVVRANPFFSPWNNRVLHDPRTRVIVQDARAHLTLSANQYDVIISEPSNPWMAGVAGLYTREFLTKVRSHLRPGGVFAQWVHTYEMDWESFAMLGRTIRAVFPDVVLMRTHRTPNDCIFLCFERNGAGLDLAQVGRNLEFARKSGNVRIPAPEIIAQLVVHDDLGAFLPSGPLQTDDRPLLEYQAPRRLHQIGRQELLDHITASERASGALAEARRRQGNVAGQLQLADFLVSVDSSPFGLVDVERATPEEKARYAELLREHARRTGLAFAQAGPWEQSVCVPAQEAAIRQLLAESSGSAGPARAAALLGLGNYRILAKDYAEGSRLLEEAVALLPHHDQALRSLQSAHELSGRYEAAANVVRRRMENGVKTPLLLSGLAYYLGRLGGDRAAWGLVEQALALDPDAPQALVVGANLLMERQEFDRAVEFARQATRAAPQEATTHVTLIRALLQAERTAEARIALVRGLAQCPGDPELLRLQQQPEKPGNGRLPAPAPGNFR